jgi:hypothetical protein
MLKFIGLPETVTISGASISSIGSAGSPFADICEEIFGRRRCIIINNKTRNVMTELINFKTCAPVESVSTSFLIATPKDSFTIKQSLRLNLL